MSFSHSLFESLFLSVSDCIPAYRLLERRPPTPSLRVVSARDASNSWTMGLCPLSALMCKGVWPNYNRYTSRNTNMMNGDTQRTI